MFPLSSHLDAPAVPSAASHLASGSPMGSVDNPVIAGLGDTVPAPLTGSNTLKNLLIVGGIAAVVYLILRELNKRKSA